MREDDLINSIDTDAIEAAIAAAEKNCSGEIRVHIETTIGAHEIRSVGERVFQRLGMTKTKDRNGVLIFLAAEEQEFVILGDEGIHEKVGDEFWEHVAQEMTDHFRHGRFTGGLVAAIHEAGERLAEHFPYHHRDVDELKNAVSFGSSDEPR
ncbi:MAG: TPM domain-containing protein [Acidobacteria bacterium]|nr:TPM domain-containing protein [Acidobacteriota bacterium]